MNLPIRHNNSPIILCLLQRVIPPSRRLIGPRLQHSKFLLQVLIERQQHRQGREQNVADETRDEGGEHGGQDQTERDLEHVALKSKVDEAMQDAAGASAALV